MAFAFVKSLRNLPGMNLATLCCFLLMGYIAFISSDREPKTTPCYLVASAIYFCFIGSFCWMNVIAFDTWLTFRTGTTVVRSLETWRLYRRYSLVSWSLSVFAVASLIAVDNLKLPGIPKSLLPKLGENWCWFGERLSLLLFFVAPMMASSIFTLVFFIKTSRLISRDHQELSRIPGIQRNRNLFKTYRRLAVSMGLTWVTAVVASFVEIPFVWYIFTFLNGLQGVFIFATFTCQKRVWENIVKVWKRKNTDVDHGGTWPRRNTSLSRHQQRRLELLHVSTSYDLAHPPAPVTGVHPQQQLTPSKKLHANTIYYFHGTWKKC
ncbi:G-protein coupled receptor Mth2-like [Macrobrachium nipponense]|uniref:G-protein coupled receptor Mth2-like n=1 Tax=Macrobrachium nipponense TaxID=159736 RepID=UPI0030C8917D